MKATRDVVIGCVLLGSSSLACENSGPERDFERMVNQAYFQYYEASEFFPDGRAMREPPQGTVPADRLEIPPALARGMVNGQYVATNPVLLTPQLVQLGRKHFETFCAPCHGVLGNGISVVAHNMELRKAPSLVALPVTSFPDGRIFQAISEGYGLMPKYSQQIEVTARWAIVAYVRALGIHTAGVPMDRLPEPIRARAEEALR